MSFSGVTKNELARITGEDCCKKAELAALVKMDGTLHIKSGKASLDVRNYNAAVARKVFSLFKELFDISPEVMVRRKVRLRKNNIYLVRVPPGEHMERILNDLTIVDGSGLLREGTPPSLLSRDCCRRSYLRGLFLGGGSISSPDRAYHLEITIDNLRHARDIKRMFKRFKLPARVSSRKNWHVVYLKESEQISRCLNVMGAHNALLDFESKRVFKEVRNRVNRLVNCETANLDKTVAAGMRQVEDIKLIDRVKGLSELPSSLRQVAETRLRYPDASLRELGELMVPPVGKSGVNHRLRKLSEIAGRMRGGGEGTF